MKQIGSLKCIDLGGKSNDDNLIILFHGFGADAYDLQTISEVLSPPGSCHWIFPQGPLEVPIGPGWTGRAWWKINAQALSEAVASGNIRSISEAVPEGLSDARKKVMSMIASLKVPWNRIILGGFSQGAMLATDIFLHAPEAPKALLVLSGALINKDEWKSLVPNRKDSRFFQCHGVSDPVLSIKGAQQLETLLTQNGMKGKLIQFPGVHEIPMEMIRAAEKFLKEI